MNSVCVYCGSADQISADYLRAARRMGATLALRGLTLVYGGGRTGLMGAVADGILEGKGQAIGVIIESMNTPAMAHPGLTRLEVVADSHLQKARMNALSEGFIALPGGYGTFDELFETLAFAQIGIHRNPVGLLNVNGYYDLLLDMLDRAEREGFIFPEHRRALISASDPDRLLDLMKDNRPSEEAVKRWMRQI
jgi:uncharacterized protein (TIGR00730 family)